MITVLSRKQDNLTSSDKSVANKDIFEFAGLSTDTKPDELIATGSTFLEVDTGDIYIFSEEGTEWYKLFSLKGGSDGSDLADPK